MTPAIRPATPADLPAIHAIYAHAVTHGTASFELTPPTLAEMTTRFGTLIASGHPWLVTEIAGHVAGYAYAGPYRPRPAYRFTVENSVYVDPAQQGRGLGRLLLTAILDAATAAGYRQMIAVIGDSGNSASIALHRACGFEHTGTFRAVGWKHGEWRDTVLMQRALGPGDTQPPPD